MSDRQFDGVRAAFWLIAVIIGVQLAMIIMGVATCMYLAIEQKMPGACTEGKFSELLTNALAVALAMYGIRKTGNGGKP